MTRRTRMTTPNDSKNYAPEETLTGVLIPRLKRGSLSPVVQTSTKYANRATPRGVQIRQVLCPSSFKKRYMNTARGAALTLQEARRDRGHACLLRSNRAPSRTGCVPRCSVAHVFIGMVDIRTHGGDHGGEAGRLGQVGNDFSSLNAGIVVLINQQRLDDHQYLVYVRPYSVV